MQIREVNFCTASQMLVKLKMVFGSLSNHAWEHDHRVLLVES